MSAKFCSEFRLTPLLNPRTGRKIKEDGPIFRQLLKKCRKLLIPFEWLLAQMRYVLMVAKANPALPTLSYAELPVFAWFSGNPDSPLLAYVNGGFAYEVNGFLRKEPWTKGPMSSKEKEMYENAGKLQTLIYGAPVWPLENMNLFLYRQITLAKSDFAKLKTGETYISRGFQSFSSSTKFIDTYACSESEREDESITTIFIARVRPDTHLITAFNPGEDEVLLPHGMIWHLDFIRPAGTKYTIGPGFSTSLNEALNRKYPDKAVELCASTRVVDITVWTADFASTGLESFAVRSGSNPLDLNLPLSQVQIR